MHCPVCGYEESKVVDSRATADGERIRRRRKCIKCGERFTTYEVRETVPIIVIKRDQSRQMFDREKLIGRLLRACGKRPVPMELLVTAVEEIENEIMNSFITEISSKKIAELAMQKLKNIDIVAYIRFVSVYREFSSVDEFMNELRKLDQANGLCNGEGQ